ncbi:hypothetical protein RA28_02055 [Ruegeria sp. ANG-S4]|uniref:DUF2141 domain-containing protein n=1 Tax=Ruegeria sp. ANG-S4 TaxID=1577904 RepID=UPI0005806A62|nr:DUF2141 domain-containing protein [Ruegeria sp. ANG-S4]KIC46592.1 hypothetical protein RA28_02055 [Ruegeria sp. ANG-S4]
MPSNSQRIFAVFVTAGLFVGGAWVASGFGADGDPAAVATAEAAQHDGLVVNLHGAHNAKGNLIVMVFDQQAAFDAMDYTKAAGYLEAPSTQASQRFDFADLKGSSYAVVAFHDENGDYDLNLDATYTPTEGYAVSGMNDLEGYPVFEYSLIDTEKPTDMTLFYWP